MAKKKVDVSEASEETQSEETQVSTGITLTYAQSVRVDINGKVHEGTVLTFATQEEADEARRIIFEAHGESPE